MSAPSLLSSGEPRGPGSGRREQDQRAQQQAGVDLTRNPLRRRRRQRTCGRRACSWQRDAVGGVTLSCTDQSVQTP